ncbi:uncharacterized protein ARMOST_02972 [Armillaria ostoyae]|uniref:Uncharacterized protein n=1 Tax=Armillaria ostoyae TaxID=47428 RepID=A0A284QT42_ARMOS|nr:uncharacterized protein ARMOST_02972 [Armillaria ostoyae]
MFLPQWLLNALRRVLRGHAGGCSPLKAILFLWRFFRRLFQRFSRTQDDGEPDKPPRRIADQGLYLPQGVECTMSLAVDGDTDEPVTTVVCRSTALPNDPRSSHGMAPLSVASHSQAVLAFEADLNPSDGHLPLHGSRPSSIAPSPIEGPLHLDARSNPSRLSQDTSTIALNSAADAHLNSSHGHLPSARSTPGKNSFPSDSEAVESAVVMSLPAIAARHHGRNENNLSTLRSTHPFFVPTLPTSLRMTGDRHTKKSVRPKRSLDCSFDYLIHPPWCSQRLVTAREYYGCSLLCTREDVSRIDTVLPAFLQELTRFLDNIISYMHTKGITLPPKVDLVLSFGWSEFEDGTHICEYYFADHMHRSIFWLDGFNADILSPVKQYNTSEPSHLAHAIEAEYWLHSGLFPVCQEMTSDTIEEVNDFLIHGIAEKAWDPSFVAAEHTFTLPELQQYFSILNSIRNNPAQSYSRPGLVGTVALILENRSRVRYVNLYGEPGPFIGSTHTIFARPLRTAVIVLLSPLLFFAPDIHYNTLYEIWCRAVSKTDWSAFVRKLSTEWQDFVINATVLLNANIAFLAIQSIDESSSDKGRSPAQIASYVSTVLSIGSIILGLLLLQKYRHHKSRAYNTPQEDFLGIQEGDLGARLGLETLAIMFSLPWALLMWA